MTKDSGKYEFLDEFWSRYNFTQRKIDDIQNFDQQGLLEFIRWIDDLKSSDLSRAIVWDAWRDGWLRLPKNGICPSEPAYLR